MLELVIRHVLWTGFVGHTSVGVPKRAESDATQSNCVRGGGGGLEPCSELVEILFKTEVVEELASKPPCLPRKQRPSPKAVFVHDLNPLAGDLFHCRVRINLQGAIIAFYH